MNADAASATANAGTAMRPLFAQLVTAAFVVVPLCSTAATASAEEREIAIGLDADYSGPARLGAIALQQGAEIAISQINAAGGVLGQKLKLVITDHRANPRRGLANFRQSVERDGVVAMLTGVHSPVALSHLQAAHQLRVPVISPWAAATPFIANGHVPNYAFRVSIRDQHAAGFLVGQALRHGFRRIAIMLENTPWGTSNERGLRAAAQSTGISQIVGETWFAFGDTDLANSLHKLLSANPDVIILVANPAEGAAVVRAMASLPDDEQTPILSHWGVTAGDMLSLTDGAVAEIDFAVLQTHSFFEPKNPRTASMFLKASCARYEICEPEDVISHTGMSHAYDAVHLIATAIADAGETNPAKIRDKLEEGAEFHGLVRRYAPSFSDQRHEALNRSDFSLARYDGNGSLRPYRATSRSEVSSGE